MNKLLILLLIAVPAFGFGQKKPVRIVFDVTSKDPETHQAVLRHVSGMAKAYPDANLEVVVYGGALPLLVKDKSSSAGTVEELALKKNVSFKVCAQTMQRDGVDQSQLINGVEVVPDGIMEIVIKQADGWGYIKESHN